MLYFYEVEIPGQYNNIEIMFEYLIDKNFQGKYVNINLSSLINIEISPIYINLSKKDITFKLEKPEEYKKILESFIEYFSYKDIIFKKELLYKLFHNEKKLYIENIFL